MRVASLHIHPVKSMRAVDVGRARVEKRGLADDRRWLVIDDAGMFLTQRSHPRLATINASISDVGLTLSCDGVSPITISAPSGERRRRVVVWDSEVDAAVAEERASAWMSPLIGENVDIVFMDEQALRMKESIWTPAPVPVSFADAFPVLVATTGSLAALNADIVEHGGDPVPMARFRPNIVIDCDEPLAEDRWTGLQIGEVFLDLVKPSDRCIVTTTDQSTGKRMGKEPLAALARIHPSWDARISGVIFGMNAVPRTLGEIAIGDAVTPA
jgi:hypothetical protein